MSTVLTEKKPYNRLNVYDYIDNFCGWKAFYELNKYAANPTQETYLLGLEKTGGRAGEVLALISENFSLDKRKKSLMVSNMKLEKHFITIKNPDGTKTRQHIDAIRKPFPVPLGEPLTRELLEKLRTTEGLLFPSPYKPHKPYSVVWGYQTIIKISDSLPSSLKQELGLNRPFINKVSGEKISDTIHLWQHYFRSQRARQLKEEYDFSEAELMEFFGWLDLKTAIHYSAVGARKLASKMLKGLEQNEGS